MKLTIELVPPDHSGFEPETRSIGHIKQATLETDKSRIVIDEIQLKLINAAFETFHKLSERIE